MALNMPVLPIALGNPPGEMLQGLQAVYLEHAGVELTRLLRAETIDLVVRRQNDPLMALYRCADEAEQRAAMMSQYADEVQGLGYVGKIRQSGALSSFHIPDKPTNHPDWAARYGGREKSKYHCELQRQERLSLEYHAQIEGCRLIVCPEITYDDYGPEARLTRLSGLLTFLESMPDEKVEIARGPILAQGESFTIVGDWFSASSVQGQLQRGYRQTIFTRHAPTIQRQILRFDDEFQEAARARPWPDAPSSRKGAIIYLKNLISSLTARSPGSPQSAS